MLDAWARIWPGPPLAGVALGETWTHAPPATTAPPRFGLVPFHKLSQWLSYSLFEPLEGAGVTITEIDELTGLPEYRNGGLFLDAGVLELVDRGNASCTHEVSWSEARHRMARVDGRVARRLGRVVREEALSTLELPFARILEGGSWRAGRVIAQRAARGRSAAQNRRATARCSDVRRGVYA